MAARFFKTEHDPGFVRVHIDGDDCHKVLLKQQDVAEIEKHILDQIYVNRGRQPYPQLRGYVFSDLEGALIITCHVDSVSWLEQVIKSYKKKALRIIKPKDIPQYTAQVELDVPQSDNVLELLTADNFGLQTSVWRLLYTYGIKLDNGRLGWCVYLLVDDRGMEVLERSNFKLFLGITAIEFQLVEKLERIETTGKLEYCDKIREQSRTVFLRLLRF